MPRFAGEPVNKPRFSGTLVEEEEALDKAEEGRSFTDFLREAPLPGPLAAIKGWPGVIESLAETVYGAKGLVTDLSEEDEANLEAIREASENMGGWGTTGRVGGEIAQMALPGAAALKGARALSAATGAGKTMSILNPLAAEVGVSAGFGALQAPEEGETRTDEAIQSGLGALGGAALGKVLKTAARGIDRSKAAQELIDEGVYLTPGQAADSMSVQMLENAAEVTPFLARGTKKAKEAAAESFNAAVLKRALPRHLSSKVNKIGTEGGAQLNQAIEEGYDAAWANVDIPPQQRASLYRFATEGAKNLGKKGARALRRIQDDIERGLSVKELDKTMRNELSATKRDNAANTLIRDMRESLRSILPEPNQQALQIMDDAYPDYLAARKAISKASEGGGVFTPRQLIQSSRQVGGEAATAAGRGPLQQTATQGMETVGLQVGGQPLDFFRRLAGAVPSPPGMRGTGQALLGQTRPQKAIQRGYDPMADLLRDYISPARVGAAYEE